MSVKRFVSGALALTCLAGASLAQPGPVVRIDAGAIRGAEVGGVRRFLGIPYAAPPVGELRWRAPQPPAPWDRVRDCLEFGPACPQPRSIAAMGVEAQSEDCLTLNVWAPPAGEAPWPVMVFFHGGGHTVGSASQPYYDGAALARASVVVVTVNYRLGPLGYLAHPALSAESDRNVSGNYGLMDQVAALRWVRANAEAFGGDPDRVTIFGESAGAVSVCRLLVCPQARGLFHRAIAQSGAARGNNRRLRERVGDLCAAETAGVRIAERLGCDSAEQLRAVDARELLTAARPRVGLLGEGTKFGPVVDGVWIPDDPERLLAQGRGADVPVILGTNADEGTIFLGRARARGPAGYAWAVKRLYGPWAEAVLELFPAPQEGDAVDALNELITAAAFVAPARAAARSLSTNGGPVWLYHFVRTPATPAGTLLGAHHGLELDYVFGRLAAAGYDDVDRRLSDEMIARWSRFAATGEPNPPGRLHWPRYDAEGDRCLIFDARPRVETGLMRDRCDLLDRVRRDRDGRQGAASETP